MGIGLALAVFIAGLLSLDHAFWVVLGTLSVLKSNALSTGRTTVQALVGTLIGFAIGTAFTVVSGTDSPILWAAFPLAVFLATYVAGAIGFVVGQAAFTVLLIILFNLIMPIGWRVGLARVEDIAVGVGISVIVSVLLWPRGARAELAGTVARLYRAVAGYLGVAFADIIINVSQGEATFRYEAVQSRDLAGEAFDRFVSERVKKVIEPEGAASLVAAGSHAILVGDLLTGVARTYVIASDAETASASGDGVVTALDEQTRVMLEGFESLAAELEGVRSSRHFVGVSEQSLRSTALECLEYWRKRPEAGPSVIAAIIACEWLQQLGELTDDLAVPVGTLAAAASEPWWR